MLFKEAPVIAKPDEERRGMKDYYKAKIEEVCLSAA
jgi:hypothetical protein